MSRFPTGAWALSFALALSGCPASDGPERAEAAAVSRAIDALRAAENPKKPDLLQALRESPCTFSDICAVRSACIAAYELHVRALGAVGDATKLVDAGDAAKAAEILSSAEAELKQASQLADGCTSAQGDMQRRYRVTQ